MFYDNLQKVCRIKKVAITNVIKELGISSGNLSKWKAGGAPKGETLLAFSQKLGVTTDYLLTGREDKEKSSETELTDTELELLAVFRQLTEVDRGRILERMHIVADGYPPEQKEKLSG